MSEMCSYAFLYFMTFHVNAKASAFALLAPLLFMRLAMMFSNWGQHALVDEVDPDHDLRSSITLIDIPVRFREFSMYTSHRVLTWRLPVQPILLQRRLPHRAPSQPAPPLARPTTALHPTEEDIRRRQSSRVPRHRFSYDDRQASE